MAELTTAETTANPCCAPEQHATCCEPSAKTECCDPSHGEGCGCAAGSTDIRETVRERYAAAAVQVATTDPGADCCAPSEKFDGGSDIAGALTHREFTQALADAGLTDVEIRETHRVHAQAASAIVRARKPSMAPV